MRGSRGLKMLGSRVGLQLWAQTRRLRSAGVLSAEAYGLWRDVSRRIRMRCTGESLNAFVWGIHSGPDYVAAWGELIKFRFEYLKLLAGFDACCIPTAALVCRKLDRWKRNTTSMFGQPHDLRNTAYRKSLGLGSSDGSTVPVLRLMLMGTPYARASAARRPQRREAAGPNDQNAARRLAIVGRGASPWVSGTTTGA